MKVILYDNGKKCGQVDVPEEVIQRLASRIEDYIADAAIDCDGTKWVSLTEDITIDGTNIEFSCEVLFDCTCWSCTDRGDHETPSNFRAWLEIKNVDVYFEDCTAYFPNGKECECTITDTAELERAISRTITTADYDYWG